MRKNQSAPDYAVLMLLVIIKLIIRNKVIVIPVYEDARESKMPDEDALQGCFLEQ